MISASNHVNPFSHFFATLKIKINKMHWWQYLKDRSAMLPYPKNITSFPLQVGQHLEVDQSERNQGILVKTYGQAGDLDKVLAAWDEMEENLVGQSLDPDGLTSNESNPQK